MATSNVFDQINNAVLNLQTAEYQTYERPLKALVKLLHHPDLETVNQKLIAATDLEEFLNGNPSDGGMVGSDVLTWPEDTEVYLSISLQLIDRFAADPNFMLHFGHTYYNPSPKLIASVRSIVGQLIIPFVRDYTEYVMNRAQPGRSRAPYSRPRSSLSTGTTGMLTSTSYPLSATKASIRAKIIRNKGPKHR